MDLNIGHLYKLTIFLSKFMSGQYISYVNKVNQNTENRGPDLGSARVGPKI